MIGDHVSIALVLLLANSCSNTAQETTQEMNNGYSEYFIETPDNVTLYLNDSNPTVFADFRCTIREGYSLLWIINGRSLHLIKHTASYSKAYSESFPLPGGNLLSFLSVPVSPSVNNSIVNCAAVNGDGDAVGHSNFALLTILKENEQSTLATSITMSSVSGSGEFTDTYFFKATVTTEEWIILSFSVLAFLLICLSTIAVMASIVVIRRQKKLNAMKAMRKDNIYWVNGKEEGQNNNMQHVGNLILEGSNFNPLTAEAGSNFKKGLEIKTL